MARDWIQSGNGHELARSLLSRTNNGKFDLVDENHGLPVSFADGSNIDSFSRLRVGTPSIVWEGKHLYGLDSHSYQQSVVGAGSSIAYRSAESSVRLTCDTGASDEAIFQTKKYIPYVPGHGQVAFMTFNLVSQPAAGCVKRVGRFDSGNGIFLEWNSTDIRLVVRTDTSGTAVDTSYATQANWNLDTLDGSGDDNNPSGITLDLTKTHILVIDYQWLGVGRVRFGFDLDGIVNYVHEVNHANTDTIVYMRTPNLPIRWEVSNTAGTAATDYLDAICSSVVSEGDPQPLAHDYSVQSTGVTVNTTRVPILAIRQNPAYNGKVNRKVALVNALGIISLGDSIVYEVTQYPEPNITITGNWVDLDLNHSTLQYATGTNITVNSEVGAHKFYKDFLASAIQGNKLTPGSASSGIGARTHHNEMLVNYDGTDCETIVIWATSLSATGTTVYVTANCLEYD